jgi:hypothetical protein
MDMLIEPFRMSNVAQTPRGKVNLFLAGATSALLENAQKIYGQGFFDYLLNGRKTAILTALGRMPIEPHDYPGDWPGPKGIFMLQVAGKICTDKMTTRQAVEFISRARGLGRVNMPPLKDAIECTIKKFRENVCGVTDDEIVRALRSILESYDRNQLTLFRPATPPPAKA